MTNEFSFVLKPSKHGVGVFAANRIEKGSFLRLFGDAGGESRGARIFVKSEVPEVFRQYCLDYGDRLAGPKDFGAIPVGWHLNHSDTPNGVHDEKYDYFALRDIEAGEEITIDYNSLGEPEKVKEDYYSRRIERDAH